MSVLIKGMEMPHNCYECWIPCTVELQDQNRLSRSKYCPCVEVKVPHGRLTDADILASMCDAPNWCVWLSEIDDAPTIIEAEE